MSSICFICNHWTVTSDIYPTTGCRDEGHVISASSAVKLILCMCTHEVSLYLE